MFICFVELFRAFKKLRLSAELMFEGSLLGISEYMHIGLCGGDELFDIL